MLVAVLKGRGEGSGEGSGEASTGGVGEDSRDEEEARYHCERNVERDVVWRAECAIQSRIRGGEADRRDEHQSLAHTVDADACVVLRAFMLVPRRVRSFLHAFTLAL